MRRGTKIAGAIGLFLLLAAGLWLLIAPGQFVKYPADLDKTAVAKGELMLYLDPETGGPAAKPQTLPLSIRRRVQVTESSGSQATVQETSTERVGPLPEQTLEHRYLIDRGSLENVAGRQAYAYTPENVTDRAPYYSINFPFGTGAGPYKVWKNEVGAAYEFRRDGPEVERDGVTLIPMVGTLKNAPAIPAYVDQLRGQGVASALTAKQMRAQLKAQGVDLEALAAEILPRMTPRERKITQALLAQPVPLNFTVSVTTRLLVEPETGAIVSLDSVEQSLKAAPDLTGFAQLGQILSTPRFADLPAVQSATAALEGIVALPPVIVFTTSYSQTTESVADFASYAKSKADDIAIVKRWIPLGLAILGAIALAAAAVTARRHRRQPPAMPAVEVPDPPRPRVYI